MSQSSTERLSPERIAHQRELAKHNNDQRTLMLLGHIETIEAELALARADCAASNAAGIIVARELEDVKAEIARLKELLNSYDCHWETLGTEVGP